MSNYKLIHDEDQLKKFINWLPDLKENETFYYCLFARKKYCPEIIKSNDRTQLKRGTTNKERLINKIKQLELPLGTLELRDVKVPQQSLVLYLMPNPRDVRKASHMASMKLQKMVFEDAKNYNPITEVTSCIQKSKSYTYVVDFDIDTKDIDLNLIKNYFNKKISDTGSFSTNLSKFTNDILTIIETKGGYHILVKPNLASRVSKTWHQDISAMYPCDQAGDQLVPVPGTYQGGFIPKIIKL